DLVRIELRTDGRERREDRVDRERSEHRQAAQQQGEASERDSRCGGVGHGFLLFLFYRRGRCFIRKRPWLLFRQHVSANHVSAITPFAIDGRGRGFVSAVASFQSGAPFSSTRSEE